MKNLSLILNILLLLGVGYLFMDKFSSKEAPKEEVAVEETADVPKIVYVNADTLLNRYERFQVKKKEIEAREKREDNALKGRGRSLEKDVRALQQEMMSLEQEWQGGNMARVDYETRGQKLMEKQQKLAAKEQSIMQDQQRIAGEIIKEGQRINDELQAEIKDKLGSLKSEMGYEYILSYGMGSGVLVADERYDITEKVLSILNTKAAEEAAGE